MHLGQEGHALAVGEPAGVADAQGHVGETLRLAAVQSQEVELVVFRVVPGIAAGLPEEQEGLPVGAPCRLAAGVALAGQGTGGVAGAAATRLPGR